MTLTYLKRVADPEDQGDTENSSDVLRRFLDPRGQGVSENVVESDPSLAEPIATTNLEQESNDKVRRLLGLGPSPALAQQRKDLDARDSAIAAAYTKADPQVSAEADKDFAEKLKLAGEPNRVAGENAVALEHVKQAPMERFLNSGAGGADNITGEPIEWKPTITENGVTLSGVPQPAMVRQQAHTATVGLGQIQNLRDLVTTLDQHGLIGPVAGRTGEALTASGLDKYLMSKDAARAFNDFKTQTSLLKSNVAMAHGGSRGGSNAAILQRFDELVNPHQSAEGIRGGLDAFERWLTAYANAKKSDEMDAADAALGVTGGGGGMADQYDNPNWGR